MRHELLQTNRAHGRWVMRARVRRLLPNPKTFARPVHCYINSDGLASRPYYDQ